MQAKQAQAEIARKREELAIAELEAKVRKLKAEAAKTESATSASTIAQMKDALEAAIQIAGAKAVADAADQIFAAAREEAARQTNGPQPQQQAPMSDPTTAM